MSVKSIKQLEKLMVREAKAEERNIERAEKELQRVEKAYKKSLKGGGPAVEAQAVSQFL